MNKVEMEKRIRSFISEIKKHWAELDIRYKYDKDDDLWEIWHFNEKLQYEDQDFQKLVGKLIRNLFYEQGVFNITFGYKYIPETPGTYDYTTVNWTILSKTSVSTRWLQGLPEKPYSSLDIAQVTSIFGRFDYSGDLHNYNGWPGQIRMRNGITGYEGENEVQVA